MKKVILGTTALVLTAGVAYADGHAGVSVGGSAELWIEDVASFDDEGDVINDDITFNNDVELTFAGSGETDGGLGFGFDFAFVDGATDNNEVYISGSWGKLTVGDVDDALQKVAGLGDIGFDGLGVDDVAEVGRGLGEADGVLYSNTIGAASVYVSMNQDTGSDDMAVGVSFDAGPVTIGLGYEDTDGNDDITVDGITALDISGSAGAIGYDVFYIDHDLGEHYGTMITYDAGVATITFGYADGETAADAAMGIGFSTDLGGGATLSGGVADAGGQTNWDLGIGMSF